MAPVINDFLGRDPEEEVLQIEDDDNIDELLSKMHEQVYPGCKKSSALKFLADLMHIKVLYKWPNESFDVLLAKLKEVLPEGSNLPDSFHKAKTLLDKLGLGYEKIDACPNDCCIYYKENADLQSCLVCTTSRYKESRSKKEKANRNKVNRANLKCVGTQGRQSMSQHRFKRVTMNNLNQLEEVDGNPFEIWADKHKRNSEFVNTEAEADYVALGSRRDSVKGLGPTQSSNSIARLQFQGSFSSTRDSEYIAQLEMQLKRQHRRRQKFDAKLECLVSALKTHIPNFPDIFEDFSDDNEDEAEAEGSKMNLGDI